MTLPYALLYLTVLSCVAMLAYRLGRRSVIWGAPPAPKVEETYSRAQVDELLEKMNQRLKMHWSYETRKYALCSNYARPNRNQFDDVTDVVKKANKTVFDDLRSRMEDADSVFVRFKWDYYDDYNTRLLHKCEVTNELAGRADVVIDQIVNLVSGNTVDRKCVSVTLEVTLPRKVDNRLPHRVERVYLQASGEPGAVELSPDEIEARRKAEQEVERVLAATKRVVGRSEAA